HVGLMQPLRCWRFARRSSQIVVAWALADSVSRSHFLFGFRTMLRVLNFTRFADALVYPKLLLGFLFHVVNPSDDVIFIRKLNFAPFGLRCVYSLFGFGCEPLGLALFS